MSSFHKFFLLSFLASIGACVPNAESQQSKFIGHYSAESESDCNLTIDLVSGGKGKIVQSCRLEDGSHKDVEVAKSASWKSKDSSIVIVINNSETELRYIANYRCENLGYEGTSTILLLESKDESHLSGYGNKFWKLPIQCKK